MASPSCMNYVCLSFILFIYLFYMSEKRHAFPFDAHKIAAVHLIRNNAQLKKASYLQQKSIWHQLRWVKCPILVLPPNVRSVSNQGICGSLQDKQKVQMQPWVLAHSHHVNHAKQSPESQPRLQLGICSHICFPPALCMSCLEVMCIRVRGRKLQLKRQKKRIRQTYGDTFPELLIECFSKDTIVNVRRRLLMMAPPSAELKQVLSVSSCFLMCFTSCGIQAIEKYQ